MKHWQMHQTNRLLLLLTLFAAVLFAGGCVWGPVVADPATPTPAPDYALTVAPIAAAPGDTVTVRGEGWSEGTVLIGLSDPQSGAPAPVVRRAYAQADVDADGIFSTTVTLPTDADWVDQPAVLVLAWNPDADEELTTELWLLRRTVDDNTPTPIPGPTDTPTNTPTATNTPTTIPTITPTPRPGQTVAPTPTRDPWTAFVTSNALNLRRGPSTGFAVVAALRNGTRLAVLGQNDNGSWLKVQVTSGNAYGEVGWLARSFTDYRFEAPIVATPTQPATATPTGQPTATSTPVTGWRAEYFANRFLDGNPAHTRTDAQVDFNWGDGSPAPGIPNNNFSARWRQTIFFNAGTYTFNVRADDGVRVWIGDDLIIDQWRQTSATQYSAQRQLNSGSYPIRIEYFEDNGGALIQFWWTRAGSATPWRAEYFANASLSGSPVETRFDDFINFDWGTGSPGTGIPADNFSARWTQSFTFEEGLYRFHAIVDDGMRVYLDGNLLLDEWRDGGVRELTFEGRLSAGSHTLRVEYYERTGNAVARFWWEKIAGFTEWKGEYWSNPRQEGNPVLTRNDNQIDFNWGGGSPAPVVPTDDFSARWSRDLYFDAGLHRFTVQVDDGARVWLDGVVILDAWQDGVERTVTADVNVSQGTHALRVDYYEHTGGALVRFNVERITATATPMPPTSTPMPTATATPTTDQTPLPLPSIVPTSSPTPTPTATWTPSATPTMTATATPDSTETPTATATSSSAGQSTQTPVALPSVVPTSSATPTATATSDSAGQSTQTPMALPSVVPTSSATPTDEPTNTPTATATSDSASQSTQTPEALPSVVPTSSATPTDEPSNTPTAEPTKEPTPTPTATALVAERPLPPTLEPVEILVGMVSGEVCLPTTTPRAMTLYFDEVNTGEIIIMNLRANQESYRLELPVGTYIAYAWWANGSTAGGYTDAVACELDDDNCTDHTLRPFSVMAGQRTGGIDICDWEAEDVPRMVR